MKNRALLSVVLLLSIALRAGEPWKLQLTNKEEQVDLKLDLYEESIDVPGMELFGPSNDQGSETQASLLTWQNDSTYLMELQNGVVVKKVVNKKLVKIPGKITLLVK